MHKSAVAVLLLPLLGGMAALSWEVIWQLRISLTFGVSAIGAAITLATMMAGMTVGAALCGRAIDGKTDSRPLRMYGVLELCIGLCGLALGSSFAMLDQFDRLIYQISPTLAPLAQLCGVVLVIFIPAACMGASIPVFGRIGDQYGISVALLYGLNTLGAAAGTLLVAFVMIPMFGLQGTAICTALINCAVGVAALTPSVSPQPNTNRKPAPSGGLDPTLDTLLVVFATGFVTFLLEVAWFRALRAAFETTTTGFAIMLSVVLLALGLAARSVPLFKARSHRLDTYLYLAGICIFLSTPLIERLDLVLVQFGNHNTPVNWFGLTMLLVGPAVYLLGVALPWYLEAGYSARGLGKIYAINTVGAVLGALSAAWVFLPTFGFVRTAWLAGFVVLGITWIAFRETRQTWSMAVAAGVIFLAVTMESGVGRTRILCSYAYGDHRVIDYSEGPDASTSVIEMTGGGRGLFIDGFAAAAFWPTAHYMSWMGSLPTLLHDDPREALVICFGTGQTTNAVRNEGLEDTTIVDVNPAVFRLGKHFPKNEEVLSDPSVHKVLMDGRAFLRRTTQEFDIITLEPMPPNHAGVNALYSKEFYELARARLRPGGMVAQWLPAHLVSEQHARSIAKTFQEVFPNAALWADPEDLNGILLGTIDDGPPLGMLWPGLNRPGPRRSLSDDGIRAALVLGREELLVYSEAGTIITDDNQHLAYGTGFSMKTSGPRDIEDIRKEFMGCRASRKRDSLKQYQPPDHAK